MAKILENIRHRFRNFMIGLSFALKRTEDTMLRQEGAADNVGIGDEQEVNENRVSKALLKGEVTQEVKNLRYRTYKVDEEAKETEYYSPLKAIKRDKQDNRHIKYKKPDDCTLILIQPNKQECESVYAAIKEYENKEKETKQFTIKIKRNFVPRFRLEEYTRRLALFSRPDGSTVADFYISKYPDPSEFKAKAFIREVKEVMDLVEELKKEKLTIVWIEHILETMLKSADRLMCMAEGKCAIIGKPKEVIESKIVEELYLGVKEDE